MSKQFSAATFIQAPPSRVWAVLTDAAQFQNWDPMCAKIVGTIGPDMRFSYYSKLAPRRPMPIRVTEFQTDDRMIWHGRSGLLRGQRIFQLRPDGAQATHFSVREVFGGRSLPIFSHTVPDRTDAFQDFAKALKAYVEAAA